MFTYLVKIIDWYLSVTQIRYARGFGLKVADADSDVAISSTSGGRSSWESTSLLEDNYLGRRLSKGPDCGQV